LNVIPDFVLDKVDLDSRQIRAATLLATGNSVKSVAENLQVSSQTICAWKSLPEFKRVSRFLKHEYMASARDAVRALSQDALNEVRRLIREGKSENVRLQASLAVLRGVGVIDHLPNNYQFWECVGHD